MMEHMARSSRHGGGAPSVPTRPHSIPSARGMQHHNDYNSESNSIFCFTMIVVKKLSFPADSH